MASQQMEVLLVVCPPGIRTGQSILVETPAGGEVEVVVPTGVQPLQEFQVEIDVPFDPLRKEPATRHASALGTAAEAAVVNVDTARGADRDYRSALGQLDPRLDGNHGVDDKGVEDEIAGELAEALAELQRSTPRAGGWELAYAGGRDAAVSRSLQGQPSGSSRPAAGTPLRSAWPAPAGSKPNGGTRQRDRRGQQPQRRGRNASPGRATQSPEEGPRRRGNAKQVPFPPTLKSAPKGTPKKRTNLGTPPPREKLPPRSTSAEANAPYPPASVSTETAGLVAYCARWVARHGQAFEQVIARQNGGTAGWEFFDEVNTECSLYYARRLRYERALLDQGTVEQNAQPETEIVSPPQKIFGMVDPPRPTEKAPVAAENATTLTPAGTNFPHNAREELYTLALEENNRMRKELQAASITAKGSGRVRQAEEDRKKLVHAQKRARKWQEYANVKATRATVSKAFVKWFRVVKDSELTRRCEEVERRTRLDADAREQGLTSEMQAMGASMMKIEAEKVQLNAQVEAERVAHEETKVQSEEAAAQLASAWVAIECPEGVRPGDAILVSGPNGEDVEIVVPEDVAAGDTFEVDIGGIHESCARLKSGLEAERVAREAERAAHETEQAAHAVERAAHEADKEGHAATAVERNGAEGATERAGEDLLAAQAELTAQAEAAAEALTATQTEHVSRLDEELTVHEATKAAAVDAAVATEEAMGSSNDDLASQLEAERLAHQETEAAAESSSAAAAAAAATAETAEMTANEAMKALEAQLVLQLEAVESAKQEAEQTSAPTKVKLLSAEDQLSKFTALPARGRQLSADGVPSPRTNLPVRAVQELIETAEYTKAQHLETVAAQEAQITELRAKMSTVEGELGKANAAVDAATRAEVLQRGRRQRGQREASAAVKSANAQAAATVQHVEAVLVDAIAVSEDQAFDLARSTAAALEAAQSNHEEIQALKHDLAEVRTMLDEEKAAHEATHEAAKAAVNKAVPEVTSAQFDEAAAQLVAVKCPEGVRPGDAILVEGPNGEDVEVIVPAGIAAGDTFEVDIGGTGETEQDVRGTSAAEPQQAATAEAATTLGVELLELTSQLEEERSAHEVTKTTAAEAAATAEEALTAVKLEEERSDQLEAQLAEERSAHEATKTAKLGVAAVGVDQAATQADDAVQAQLTAQLEKERLAHEASKTAATEAAAAVADQAKAETTLEAQAELTVQLEEERLAHEVTKTTAGEAAITAQEALAAAMADKSAADALEAAMVELTAHLEAEKPAHEATKKAAAEAAAVTKGELSATIEMAQGTESGLTSQLEEEKSVDEVTKAAVIEAAASAEVGLSSAHVQIKALHEQAEGNASDAMATMEAAYTSQLETEQSTHTATIAAADQAAAQAAEALVGAKSGLTAQLEEERSAHEATKTSAADEAMQAMEAVAVAEEALAAATATQTELMTQLEEERSAHEAAKIAAVEDATVVEAELTAATATAAAAAAAAAAAGQSTAEAAKVAQAELMTLLEDERSAHEVMRTAAVDAATAANEAATLTIAAYTEQAEAQAAEAVAAAQTELTTQLEEERSAHEETKANAAEAAAGAEELITGFAETKKEAISAATLEIVTQAEQAGAQAAEALAAAQAEHEATKTAAVEAATAAEEALAAEVQVQTEQAEAQAALTAQAEGAGLTSQLEEERSAHEVTKTTAAEAAATAEEALAAVKLEEERSDQLEAQLAEERSGQEAGRQSQREAAAEVEAKHAAEIFAATCTEQAQVYAASAAANELEVLQAKHEVSLEVYENRQNALQSELAEAETRVRSFEEKEKRANEALNATCVKHELSPDVVAKVEKAPKQLHGLVMVLPYVDKRTLMLAMAKAANVLKSSEENFAKWDEELEIAMRFFVGPPDQQQRYLQSCTFLFKQAQKAPSTEKMEGSLRPLGFEDMHMQVLKQTLAWASSEELFASFEVQYEPSDMDTLEAEGAEKQASAAASLEKVQADLEEAQTSLQKELEQRQEIELELERERVESAAGLESERANNVSAESRAEAAEAEQQSQELELRDEIERKNEDLAKAAGQRKEMKDDLEQEMEFQVGKETKKVQKAEAKCQQLEQQLASSSQSGDASSSQVAEEARLRQQAEARCEQLQAQVESMQDQMEAMQQAGGPVGSQVTQQALATQSLDPVPVQPGNIDLEMGIAAWLSNINCTDTLSIFEDEGVETVEDATFMIQSQDDLNQIGMTPEQSQRVWQHLEAALKMDDDDDDQQPVEALSAPENPSEAKEAEVEEDVDTIMETASDEAEEPAGSGMLGSFDFSAPAPASAPVAVQAVQESPPKQVQEQAGRVSISLEMSIGEWLAAFGASQYKEALQEQEVETLEDLTFVIAVKSDLKEMGIDEEAAPRLWDALVAAKKLEGGGSYIMVDEDAEDVSQAPAPADSDDDGKDEEDFSSGEEEGFVVAGPKPSVPAPVAAPAPADSDDDSEDDDDESSDEESSSDDEGFIVAASAKPAAAVEEAVTLEMEVGEWLELCKMAKHTKLFMDEDCETIEDVAMIIQDEGDFESMGISAGDGAVLWRAMQAATGDAGDGEAGGEAVSLEMPIRDWLELHNMAKHTQLFLDEDCETLEDLTLIAEEADDFEGMGINDADGAVIWRAMEALVANQ